MSDAKLREDVSRAARAKDLVESEMLNEAFAELEKAYIEFWRATKVEDEKGREKLFLAVNMVGKVKQHLQMVLSNGVLARRELEEMSRVKPEWHKV